LAKLKPVFDKPFGKLTAGNSSQKTDGAALLFLGSKRIVDQYKLSVLGKIKRVSWAALDPSVMGLGPVYAISKILEAENLKLEDIDYWELNEAYAGQVLACLKALESEEFCKKELNQNKAWGKINLEKINVDGGAVSLGHPVGASGARVVLHLLHVLKTRKAKRGIASLCIGGGQGGAILLESSI
ncbi:MAG: 3-ketoacyl-CoA thiolase, partial [Francisellaceae bacterium]|nr:3-ketoacyl-CoA thiolase [Francisellaceae bacterium]